MRINNHHEPIPVKPIICKRCKSKEITIITEYHKSIFCRILKAVCLIVLITLTSYYLLKLRDENKQIPTAFIIIPAITYAITECVQQYIESKTNIQCICKDCGNYWLHNET